MEADFAVELGADSETLEFPWAAAADGPRYYDLKRHPELLAQVEEAQRVPELGKLPNAMHGKARKSVQKKKSSERPANLARMLICCSPRKSCVFCSQRMSNWFSD